MPNDLTRMKTLIDILNSANQNYYGDNESSISDFEYDKYMDELKEIEQRTGVVFSSSPTNRVGGASKTTLEKVKHTKPMLSAQKTKSIDELFSFFGRRRSILSWKLDGLTIVLRYKDGSFYQALTRGEDGLVGEDVTHSVKYIRGVPKKVLCKNAFEVRGEGVITYADFQCINRFNHYSNPRNAASGLIRATTIDRNKLSHLDFVAFELIDSKDDSKTKEDQLDKMSLYGFNVIDANVIPGNTTKEAFERIIKNFDPKAYTYPVDGLILEYDNIAYGKSLGATTHHENRMIALKWNDDTYETTFRGIDLSAGKNGAVTITALFDEVEVDGVKIKRADFHSLSDYERFELGIGDKIQIHRANMVMPQVVENLTRSKTYVLPMNCPCCGAPLEVKTSMSGTKQLYCPNENCIGKNSQKIARYCDSDAMNIKGLSAVIIEKLLTYGVITKCSDIYHLEDKRTKILDIPGIGIETYNNIVAAIKDSRRCHLSQFLVGVGIPLMSVSAAESIDKYFYGSFDKFEEAIRNKYAFNHISDVSEALNRNIYKWYNDKNEQDFYKPLLQEISFTTNEGVVGEDGNPFKNANVVVTGIVNNMNVDDTKELLTLMGSNVSDFVNMNTTYLIVGKEPNTVLLLSALQNKVQIITESHFQTLLTK